MSYPARASIIFSSHVSHFHDAPKNGIKRSGFADCEHEDCNDLTKSERLAYLESVMDAVMAGTNVTPEPPS